MNPDPEAITIDKWILSHRGKKNKVDPFKPYAWLVEKERQMSGKIEDVATIFLTNMECPFHCLMCDLWKNTTDRTVPVGAIPAQIEWALSQMPKVKHLKLYSSGSFFDNRAIPQADYPKIASLLKNFETVIVESHPKFIGDSCLQFRDMLEAELQIAIGLETIHTEILQKLNKHVTLDDFEYSVQFLTRNEIRTRAFILLRPPYLNESEGIIWAKKSIDLAFSVGVECCIVIPVRVGNGAMDKLMDLGQYSPPSIESLEEVLDYGINLNVGRVFADTWDLKLFSTCDECIESRIERITKINLEQCISNSISCSCYNF